MFTDESFRKTLEVLDPEKGTTTVSIWDLTLNGFHYLDIPKEFDYELKKSSNPIALLVDYLRPDQSMGKCITNIINGVVSVTIFSQKFRQKDPVNECN